MVNPNLNGIRRFSGVRKGRSNITKNRSVPDGIGDGEAISIAWGLSVIIAVVGIVYGSDCIE